MRAGIQYGRKRERRVYNETVRRIFLIYLSVATEARTIRGAVEKKLFCFKILGNNNIVVKIIYYNFLVAKKMYFQENVEICLS